MCPSSHTHIWSLFISVFDALLYFISFVSVSKLRFCTIVTRYKHVCEEAFETIISGFRGLVQVVLPSLCLRPRIHADSLISQRA